MINDDPTFKVVANRAWIIRALSTSDKKLKECGHQTRCSQMAVGGCGNEVEVGQEQVVCGQTGVERVRLSTPKLPAPKIKAGLKQERTDARRGSSSIR